MPLLKLSSRSQYGLRLIVQIARNCWGPMSIAEIAKKEKLSPKYLEEIVRALKKSKLVTSTRGAEGGYRLTKAPSAINLGEVIQALERPVKRLRVKDATLNVINQKISAGLESSLSQTTLADLVRELKNVC